jgi:acyl carrier protein
MDIETTVERFIIDELLVGNRETKLDPNQSLVSSGVIDSLAILRLIAFLEERFGIIVEDEEVVSDNFDTLNIITAFVEGKK